MTSSDQYDEETHRQAWAIYQETLRLNRLNGLYAMESQKIARVDYDAHVKLRLAQKNPIRPTSPAPMTFGVGFLAQPAPKLGFWATFTQNHREASQQRQEIWRRDHFADRILRLRYGPEREPVPDNYLANCSTESVQNRNRRWERNRVKEERYAEAIRLYGYTERGLRHAGI